MRKLALLALLLPSTAAAQSVKFEKPVFPANPGGIVMIIPEVDGSITRWRTDKELVEFDLEKLFGPQLAAQAKGKVYIAPMAAGKYKVEAWTAKDFGGGKAVPSDIAVCWVQVGEAPNPPDPKPPDPKPPEPKPPSALTVKLQAAYTADAAPASTKAGAKVMLQGLYEAMADHTKDTKISTTGQLLDDLKVVAKKMIAPEALIECRKVISAEIAVNLGTNPDAKLDPDLRPRAIETFQKIARSLGEVK